MAGGASLRRFFRVAYEDGATAVGMFVPDASASEEVVDGAAAGPKGWPFLEVLELLRARGVDVPQIFGRDTRRGWLLLEDLGQQTLADCLAASPARKTELYQRAVADLAAAQLALDPVPAASVVSQRRFDVALLQWEIVHFREWCLQARGYDLSPEQQQHFDANARELAAHIAQLPYGFVHRDYQSRNLMVCSAKGGERLAWVDFQDAMLGPRIYDLVALLSDSYQSFDEPFIDARLREYVQERGLGPDAHAAVRREFDLVTIQRKLKDAGRFVFIQHKKQDSSYLKFIDPSLNKIRSAMQRVSDAPGVSGLKDLLDELEIWPDDEAA